jgi:uncharacterized protein (TIGR02646 family)
MIKHPRSPSIFPKSLDPNDKKYLDEMAYNKKIITANSGKPWGQFSNKLKFKLYANDEDVKKALSTLFGNKCAYCEVSLDNEDLHTEHFRPKAMVDIKDHSTEEGYWWLAATWENMLPACNHCNRSPGTDHVTSTPGSSGKGNRFPLFSGSIRANAPGGETAEKHLFIDPTVDEPAEYFSFKQINSQSVAYELCPDTTALEWARADATISILGLNRSGLTRKRNKHLLHVKDYVDSYLTAAERLNRLTKHGTSPSELAEAQTAMDKAWEKLYTRYLSDIKHEFLHATIRCIETEFKAAGLSLKNLLGGRPLYLPHALIS